MSTGISIERKLFPEGRKRGVIVKISLVTVKNKPYIFHTLRQ